MTQPPTCHLAAALDDARYELRDARHALGVLEVATRRVVDAYTAGDRAGLDADIRRLTGVLTWVTTQTYQPGPDKPPAATTEAARGGVEP